MTLFSSLGCKPGILGLLSKFFPRLTTGLSKLMRFPQLLFPLTGPRRKSLMPWAFFLTPPFPNPHNNNVKCTFPTSTPVWYCLVVSWGELLLCSSLVCLFVLKVKSIRCHLLLPRTCSHRVFLAATKTYPEHLPQRWAARHSEFSSVDPCPRSGGFLGSSDSTLL